VNNALRLLLALTLAAPLAACGGDDPSASPPRLDPTVAARLAAASEQVALALDEHGCADTELRALKRQVSGAGVPTAVRREIGRVIDRAPVACPEAAPPPITIPTVADGEDEGHGRGHGKDKGEKKKKHKHEDEGGDD
jgi:hypothetical protein